MRRLATFLIPIAVCVLMVPAAAQDERQELKERMRKRYPLRSALTDAGKVGETDAGFVEAVKDAYRAEKADPKDEGSPTVGELVDAENADRRRLYALLAKELRQTPEEVAKQNAIRSFKKAAPDHFLKVSGKGWVRKRDVKEDGALQPGG